MANREELIIIRGARSGDAACQLALGKLYLFGGASLPCNLPTALHWLCRAGAQGMAEAWQLIGRHISLEHALNSREIVLPLYARAAEDGVGQAALVLAELLLQDGDALEGEASWRATALTALRRISGKEARQLLTRLLPPAAAPAPAAAGKSAAVPPLWTAAAGNAAEAQYELLDRIWQENERHDFLACALPLARSLVAAVDGEAQRSTILPLHAAQVLLLSRCAQALAEQEGAGDDLPRMRELAALGGDRTAQLALGLALARMNTDGDRVEHADGTVNFKRALRWLAQAGEQGLADAWFAMSRIYIRPEFSQRSLREAHACLEKAADMGHSGAQLECGIHAWRARRGDEQNDVKAAYWLQKAAAQGSAEAQAALDRIAPAPAPAGWAEPLMPLLTRELFSCQPLLAARIQLAALLRLTRAEALLLDVKAADQGHCLVVDIRAHYGRSKRRLVLVRSAQQRQALDRIIRQFEQVDCSLAGPEGNYRQRLYRFKTWVMSVAGAGLVAA
jgi:TPR repeat protein